MHKTQSGHKDLTDCDEGLATLGNLLSVMLRRNSEQNSVSPTGRGQSY